MHVDYSACMPCRLDIHIVALKLTNIWITSILHAKRRRKIHARLVDSACRAGWIEDIVCMRCVYIHKGSFVVFMKNRRGYLPRRACSFLSCVYSTLSYSTLSYLCVCSRRFLSLIRPWCFLVSIQQIQQVHACVRSLDREASPSSLDLAVFEFELFPFYYKLNSVVSPSDRLDWWAHLNWILHYEATVFVVVPFISLICPQFYRSRSRCRPSWADRLVNSVLPTTDRDLLPSTSISLLSS